MRPVLPIPVEPRAEAKHYRAMTNRFPAPRFRLRVVFSPDEMIGPGKAELLEHIARNGSIAAAGREMNMSYKRAWQLVETMNTMFAEPVVRSTRGGASRGGAELTPMGREVLAAYRLLEDEARQAARTQIEKLQGMLRNRGSEN